MNEGVVKTTAFNTSGQRQQKTLNRDDLYNVHDNPWKWYIFFYSHRAKQNWVRDFTMKLAQCHVTQPYVVKTMEQIYFKSSSDDELTFHYSDATSMEIQQISPAIYGLADWSFRYTTKKSLKALHYWCYMWWSHSISGFSAQKASNVYIVLMALYQHRTIMRIHIQWAELWG